MRIENWSMTGGSVYDAPEVRNNQLRGKVYGHSNFPDGHPIRTSNIMMVEGDQVTTSNGSVYTLGKPDPDYMIWCQENNYHVPTPEEPIKLC